MCGITGVVALDPATRGALDLKRLADTMTSALVHRGPDAGGVWCEAQQGVAFGHRRLAIVDLSPRGHQPMRRAASPLVITFNGEIYNFRTLRMELESEGIAFESGTDTETILAAVDAWGLDKALTKMEGAFAFAIWDTSRHELHLARDRTGQKPLHMCIARQHLLFSSELRSLRASGLTTDRASPEAVAAYLAYGYVPEPLSMIEGVGKLPPGKSVTLAIGTAKPPSIRQLIGESRTYWEVPRRSSSGAPVQPIGQSIDQVDNLLSGIVAEQLECDVPVGLFLSGGIDSSIVAAKVKQVARRKVGAYTVRFPHAGFDESAHAARIAAHLGLDHHVIELGAPELLSCVRRESPRLDEPTANPSYFPLQLMSRHARTEVTVALSGDGGDEVFAGYNRYRALLRLFRLRRLPLAGGTIRAAIDGVLRHDMLLRPLQGILSGLIPQATPKASMERLQRFFAAPGHGAAYRGVMRSVQAPTLAALLSACPEPEFPVFSDDDPDWLRHMMRDDMVMYLPGDNLAKVDRASMREALEVRLPLLDRRLIELAADLPNQHLLSGNQTKRVLRLLLDRHLPRHLIERPKMGFSVPIESWLMTDLRSWADSALRSPGLNEWAGIRQGAAEEVWRKFVDSDGRTNGRLVWSLAILSEWIGPEGGGIGSVA